MAFSSLDLRRMVAFAESDRYLLRQQKCPLASDVDIPLKVSPMARRLAIKSPMQAACSVRKSPMATNQSKLRPMKATCQRKSPMKAACQPGKSVKAACQSRKSVKVTSDAGKSVKVTSDSTKQSSKPKRCRKVASTPRSRLEPVKARIVDITVTAPCEKAKRVRKRARSPATPKSRKKVSTSPSHPACVSPVPALCELATPVRCRRLMCTPLSRIRPERTPGNTWEPTLDGGWTRRRPMASIPVIQASPSASLQPSKTPRIGGVSSIQAPAKAAGRRARKKKDAPTPASSSDAVVLPHKRKGAKRAPTVVLSPEAIPRVAHAEVPPHAPISPRVPAAVSLREDLTAIVPAVISSSKPVVSSREGSAGLAPVGISQHAAQSRGIVPAVVASPAKVSGIVPSAVISPIVPMVSVHEDVAADLPVVSSHPAIAPEVGVGTSQPPIAPGITPAVVSSQRLTAPDGHAGASPRAAVSPRITPRVGSSPAASGISPNASRARPTPGSRRGRRLLRRVSSPPPARFRLSAQQVLSPLPAIRSVVPNPVCLAFSGIGGVELSAYICAVRPLNARVVRNWQAAECTHLVCRSRTAAFLAARKSGRIHVRDERWLQECIRRKTWI